MRRFLFYSFIIVFASSGLAYYIYARTGLIYVPERRLFTLNYCSDSKEYNDIIFIGGSRVARHINPAIIDSVNGIKSYCLNISGIGIVECNLLLNKYLQIHPKPKTVFLNIDADMFYTDKVLYNSTYYFSYLNDTLINRCLSPYKLVYRSKLVQKYYTLQKLFATTDQVKAIHLGIESPKMLDTRDTIDYRGYHPTFAGWNSNSEDELNNKIELVARADGFDLLQKMINRCRHDSINIVFLYAPIYYKVDSLYINQREILNRVKAIAAAANVPYLDYSNMGICKSKDFFFDMVHLNIKGATIYSRRLAVDIKKYSGKTGIFFRNSEKAK